MDVTDAVSLEGRSPSRRSRWMKAAAKRLEFEEATHPRDRIKELRAQQIYRT